MKYQSRLKSLSRALLYCLLNPIRYFVSFVFFVVACIFFVIQWALIGFNNDAEGGLLGLGSEFIIFCESLNKWAIRRVCYFKPHGWTFRGAVRMYKATVSSWIARGRSDYEYRKFIINAELEHRNTSDFFPERRFWSYIKSKVEKPLDK